MAAFVIGTGAVAIVERWDDTVRRPRDVTEHLGTPPIVAIPYVSNDDDLLRTARQRAVAALASCAWAAVVLYLVMTPA